MRTSGPSDVPKAAIPRELQLHRRFVAQPGGDRASHRARGLPLNRLQRCGSTARCSSLVRPVQHPDEVPLTLSGTA
jgi:hypothetical protein